MDISGTVGAGAVILFIIILAICVIVGLWDSFFGEYEDWYSFDTIEGYAVGIRKNSWPNEHEFTDWSCLVHVITEDGETKLFKTSPMLYKNLEEDKLYRFFTRDNELWQVLELDTRLYFKAK